MIKSINSKELAALIGKSVDTAQRIIQSGSYKGQALQVRQEKSLRGKPSYFVLWDTEANQPVQETEHANRTDLHLMAGLLSTATDALGAGLDPRNLNAETERRSDVASHSLSATSGRIAGSTDLSAVPPSTAPLDRTDAVIFFPFPGVKNERINPDSFVPTNQPAACAGVSDSRVIPYSYEAAPASAPPVLPDETQAATLPQAENLAVNPHQSSFIKGEIPPVSHPPFIKGGNEGGFIIDPATNLVIDPATGEVLSYTDPRAFETYLDLYLAKLKTKGASPASLKASRYRYRQQFKQTKKIPAVLLGQETRGRGSSVDSHIANRFEQIVKGLADKTNPATYRTRPHRKVTNVHAQLEAEFGQKISLDALRTLKETLKLSPYFEQEDDEDAQPKARSFFSQEPVFKLLFLDGSTSDFIKIRHPNGDFKPFSLIAIQDYGSRRILCAHAYWSETNENGVDLFNRLLSENRFLAAPVYLRGDRAKAFTNLFRVLNEVNKKALLYPGFKIIEDFPPAASPKWKSPLERLWRTFHDRLEYECINRFTDRIAAQVPGKKMYAKTLRDITMIHLDISLDELNESGLVQAWQAWWNSTPHTFSHQGATVRHYTHTDGERMVWVPDNVFNYVVNSQDTFTFSAADLEINRIYGYPKVKATVTRDGYITVKGEKYDVTDRHLRGKDIAYSKLDANTLALFANAQDGAYLNQKALKRQATEKSEKIIAMHREKEAKAVDSGTYPAIKGIFEANGLDVTDEALKPLFAQGLSFEMTSKIFSQNPKIQVGDGSKQSNGRRWLLFVSAAKEALIKPASSTITRNIA